MKNKIINIQLEVEFQKSDTFWDNANRNNVAEIIAQFFHSVKLELRKGTLTWDTKSRTQKKKKKKFFLIKKIFGM